MADNETNIGNPSVDVDIVPKVVLLEHSLAQVARTFAELKPVIYARVAIDRQVTGGVGEQVQRAVDEATGKFRFAMKTMGNAEELQTGLRACQADLEMMVGQAKELKINLGGQAVSLTGKQQVAPFISNIPNLVGAAVPAGTAAKLSIVGKEQIEMTAAATAASARINTFGHALEQATRATIAKTRAEETAANQLNLAQRIGAGQPLRRAIAPAITSALGGSDAAAITGGIMAMVMQSMVFRMGWGMMGLAEQGAVGLANLPGQVGAANLEYEMEAWKRKRVAPNETEEVRSDTIVGTNAALYRVVHDTGIVASTAQDAMSKLAETTNNYDEAFDKATQFAAIAAGEGQNPKTRDTSFLGLMTGYEQLKQSGDVKGVGAFIDAHPELRREMRKEWEHFRPRSDIGHTDEEKAENKDIAFQTYLNSGRIGPRMLDHLIANVAKEDYHALEIAQAADTKAWFGTMEEAGSKYYWENLGPQRRYLQRRGIKDPQYVNWDVPPWRAAPMTGRSPGATDIGDLSTKPYSYLGRSSLPGLTGETTPLSIDDERKNVKGHYYQFASITGLAEQMQMMASGGGIPEQQLSEAQKTNTTLTEMNNKMGHGGAQHAPLGRMLSIEGPAG